MITPFGYKECDILAYQYIIPHHFWQVIHTDSHNCTKKLPKILSPSPLFVVFSQRFVFSHARLDKLSLLCYNFLSGRPYPLGEAPITKNAKTTVGIPQPATIE